MDDIEIRVTIAGQTQEVIAERLGRALQPLLQNEEESRTSTGREWQVSHELAKLRDDLRKVAKEISSSQRQEKGEEE